MPDQEHSELPAIDAETAKALAQTLSESDELPKMVVAALVAVGTTALLAILAEKLRGDVERELERSAQEVTNEFLKPYAHGFRNPWTELKRPLVPQPDPLPWSEAIVCGAANLIDFFPDEELHPALQPHPLHKKRSSRLRR